MSRFPHFSETFIAREMTAVDLAGCDVLPIPLMQQRQDVVHPVARRWVEAAAWTGLRQGLLRANLRAARGAPRAYVCMWRDGLRGSATNPTELLKAAVVLCKAALIAERARDAGVDHLHAHYATHPALAAWAVRRLTGLPYSVTAHAHDLFVSAPMRAEKLGAAEFIATVSEFNVEHICKAFGADIAAKTHVVRCGVDSARYQTRVRTRMPVDTFKILTIGSLQEYKGQRHLIEACGLLQRRGVDVCCDIVGEGVLRPVLQRQIDDLGLGRAIRLVGVRSEDEVVAMLHAADVYVQPSVVAADGQMEGVPVALMEAMAAGVPVIASALSGIPELVRHRETGLLVPPADAPALVEAVLDVLHDPQATALLRSRGADLVETCFDVNLSARRLSDLFAHVVRTAGAPTAAAAARPRSSL